MDNPTGEIKPPYEAGRIEVREVEGTVGLAFFKSIDLPKEPQPYDHIATVLVSNKALIELTRQLQEYLTKNP